MPKIAIPTSVQADVISEKDAALELGISTEELGRARARGEIPPGVFWIVGQRRVRYSRSKLTAWRDAGAGASRATQAAAAA